MYKHSIKPKQMSVSCNLLTYPNDETTSDNLLTSNIHEPIPHAKPPYLTLLTYLIDHLTSPLLSSAASIPTLSPS